MKWYNVPKSILFDCHIPKSLKRGYWQVITKMFTKSKRMNRVASYHYEGSIIYELHSFKKFRIVNSNIVEMLLINKLHNLQYYSPK